MKKQLTFLALIVVVMSLTSFCDNGKCKGNYAKKILHGPVKKTNDAVFNMSPLMHFSEL